MIIYQASPSRLYPIVLQEILNTIKMKSDEFHYPFQVKSIYKWFNQNNLLQGIHKDCQHIRNDGFLYGVFSNSHLNLEKEDFIFSILNHPIDHIYECFVFSKFIRNPIAPHFNARRNDTFIDRVNGQTTVFQTLEDKTLEQYIDLVLNNDDFSFKYLDIEYATIPESIYGFSDVSHFSHIGKFSNLKHTFKKLSQVFGIELQLPEDQRINSFVGDFYKRDLLEEKFKKQIEFYENLEEIYKI